MLSKVKLINNNLPTIYDDYGSICLLYVLYFGLKKYIKNPLFFCTVTKLLKICDFGLFNNSVVVVLFEFHSKKIRLYNNWEGILFYVVRKNV